MALVRIGNLRVRPGGSDRLSHRAEPAAGNSADLGSMHHGAGRDRGDVPSEQRISVHRSAGDHAYSDYWGLFPGGNYFFTARLPGGARWICAAHGNYQEPEDAL